MGTPDPFLLALCLAGLVGGLWALWRGLVRHRSAALVTGLSTSRIGTLAAGEVRLTGTVEPAEVLLRSPLQDRECVWYRSRIEASDGRRTEATTDERGIGFRLRDDSGSIRVFPRGARLDLPTRYDARTGLLGDLPPDLHPRSVESVGVGESLDREAAIAALLTVRQPGSLDDFDDGDAAGWPGGGTSGGRRRFLEARLEPGDVVTVIGSALPFGQLDDPSGADALELLLDPTAALRDPEVAADIAAAREDGTLLAPEQAWGNAAIPGFGIGRPVRPPVLHPEATPPVLGTDRQAEEARATFDIDPDRLVLASSAEAPLLVAWGTPGEVASRDHAAFMLGLLGAIVAIGSALAGAMLLAAS